MNYNYDINFKNELTIEQVKELVAELGGEPRVQGDVLVSKTICHHSKDELNEASHKLYYYDNTHLFKCYTDCGGEPWDIFELVRKVKSLELETDYQLPQAIHYVAQFFGYSPIDKEEETPTSIEDDFRYLNNYERISNINLETKIVELKEYDDNFLNNLPQPLILPWVGDGISKEVMKEYEIHYNPKTCGVVIPHRNVEGKLIGVRERTLIKEDAELYGKYRPMKVNGKMYNHPLSFNLYGLYQNQENIKKVKKAFVLEGEKSVLQYATMFGQENNIAIAACGSSFISYQAWLLINMGVKEIVIGMDRQYQELNDNEHKKLVRNLKNIHNKYGGFVTISYLFDKENLLPYKASPTDMGKDVFLELYKRRVNLY